MLKQGGFIYALQPIGMDVVKIGATRDPLQRADIIASFSPVPMVFRHLLDVGTVGAAFAFEAYILGMSCHSGGHAEWRSDLALIDDLFAGVAPAVDVTGKYIIPIKAAAKGSIKRVGKLEDRLIFSSYLARCQMPGLDARLHIGMNGYTAPSKRAISRARNWLDANPIADEVKYG